MTFNIIRRRYGPTEHRVHRLEHWADGRARRTFDVSVGPLRHTLNQVEEKMTCSLK